MYRYIAVFTLLGVAASAPVSAPISQPAYNAQYLQQYYAQQAQKPQETPIFEPEAQQQQQPQYVQQGQQIRLKDTVGEQVQRLTSPPQVQYISRPVQPQAQAQRQVQYVQQPQQLQQVQYYNQPQQQQPQYRAPAPQKSQPQRPQVQKLIEEENPADYDPNPSYQFGFDVKDDEFTNYQNRKEQRDGDVIKGSYSVVDSDGFIRTVTYTADPKEGFKAEVSRTPTDIVVKIPTPAPQLEQSLRGQHNSQYLQGSQGQPQHYRAQQVSPGPSQKERVVYQYQ